MKPVIRRRINAAATYIRLPIVAYVYALVNRISHRRRVHTRRIHTRHNAYIYVYTPHTYTRTHLYRTRLYVHAYVGPCPTLAGPLAVFRTFAVHYNTNITT